jgi:transcriptional regulator with XRE-family HTH domain
MPTGACHRALDPDGRYDGRIGSPSSIDWLVSQRSLSDLETGKSEGRPGALRRIAIALGIRLDDVVPSANRDTEAAQVYRMIT